MSDIVVGKGLGPAVGIPLVTGSILAKGLGEYITDRQLRKILELMRSQSPIGEPIEREIAPLMTQQRMTPAAQSLRSGLAGAEQ